MAADPIISRLPPLTVANGSDPHGLVHCGAARRKPLFKLRHP
jgi:hypothetical protein